MAQPKKKGKQTSSRGVTKNPRRWLVAFAFSTLSGAAIFLSFPNFLETEFFPIQWVALVPLLFVLRDKTPRQAFFWGWWAGFVTNLGGFYWISHLLVEFGHLPPLVAGGICTLNAVYQGLVMALWAAGSVFFVYRCKIHWLVAAPITFVVAEALIPLIFPWYMANGQYRFYPIIQMVEVTGIFGLTWLILYVNVAVFLAASARLSGRPWPRKVILTAFAFFAIALVYGLVRMAQVDQEMEDAPKMRVGLVEADIGILEKESKGLSTDQQIKVRLFNLVKHQRLSQDLAKEGADLVVWPESSYLPVGFIHYRRGDLVAVAVGERGAIYERRKNTWVAPALPEGSADATLQAVWGDSQNHIVAVGTDGVVLHFDGRTWKGVRTATRADFRAVAGSAGSQGGLQEIWIAGEGGEVLRLDADLDLHAPKFPDRVELYGIAVGKKNPESQRTVLAVGAAGSIYSYDETRDTFVKEELRPGIEGAFRGVWAGEGGVGIAVGDGGMVYHRALDARTRRQVWLRQPVEAGGALNAVWGRSLDDVYAVGDGGRVLHYDGTDWEEEASGVQVSLTGVGGTPDGQLFVVARGGQLLEREWTGGWGSVVTPGTADLLGVVGAGFSKGYELPIDVQALYVSGRELPVGETPEEVYYDERRTLAFEADRTAVQRGFRLPILFGTIVVQQEEGSEDLHPYNTALLVDAEGQVAGRYDKNHLLIFGEYIPFGDVFPKLYEWIPGNHFYPGTTIETIPFQLGDRQIELGVLICYEDILPRFTRRVAAKGAGVFINVTNDAWFGKTAEPYLHLALAIFRTVENRRFMVRSTNTGVSAFIDANGRIIAETSLDGAETLLVDVPVLSGETLYTRFGDVFIVICFIAIALFVIHGYWPQTRQGAGRS